MNNKLCYLDVASDFMKNIEIDQIITKYSHLLNNFDIARCKTSILAKKSSVILFIISGGVEGKVLKLVKNRLEIFPQEPIVLLAHSENNSLPAALEILARLKQDNIEGRIFQISSESDKSTITEMLKFLSRQDQNKSLSGKRIGLIGAPSDWLIASSPTASLVQEKWGVKVIDIDIEELFREYERIELAKGKEQIANFKNHAAAIIEPNNTDLNNAVKIYLALKNIVKDYQLDALSLRCFDLVTKLNTTGCFALAQLNSEGICASCEGDVVSLLGMVWSKNLTSQIPWMANPSKIDVNQKELLLAHCTIAFNFIENYTIRSHFESGIGVGIKGRIPHVPVTLLRIGGKELDRIWTAEGVIEENTDSDNLCRTQVKISIKDSDKLSKLLNDPLGNHLLLTKGYYEKLFLENW